MKYATIGSKETIAFVESYGRYLAEDLFADQDIPSFDRSQYDGFAINARYTIQEQTQRIRLHFK